MTLKSQWKATVSFLYSVPLNCTDAYIFSDNHGDEKTLVTGSFLLLCWITSRNFAVSCIMMMVAVRDTDFGNDYVYFGLVILSC
jgi:hypothetical protein